jgi:predicted O-methyltransferase YrrM
MRKLKKLLLLAQIAFHDPTQAFDRVNALLEIYLNLWFFNKKPSFGLALNEFLKLLPTEFAAYAKEGERELSRIIANFISTTKTFPSFPFPNYYNADRTLAILCYGFVRWLKPEVVLETGVGYGISSSIILTALQYNGVGQLISIDLPPLGDYKGNFIGLAVPHILREKWTLKRGNTRRLLPEIVNNLPVIDMFLSDSANVYTLQRFEFEQIFKKMSSKGVCIFNNISLNMLRYLAGIEGLQLWTIKQEEKQGCFTGILMKK